MPLPGLTHAALLQALRTQLKEGTQPEVRSAYERLLAEGCDHHAAMERLAGALRAEVNAAVETNGEHAPDRYRALLAALRGPAAEE